MKISNRCLRPPCCMNIWLQLPADGGALLPSQLGLSAVPWLFTWEKLTSVHTSNRQLVPVNICPETNACDVCVISTADALCSSHAFKHNFQLFVTQRWALWWTFLVSLESPDRHSLPLSHWLHQSPQVSSCQKIQRVKVRGLCKPVDWASTSYPLFTESLVQVLSDKAEKMRWCPIMHEPHMLSLMKRHMFQEYW
jgi:hypothetical protein